MIRENKTKRILKSGGVVLGTFLAFSDPSVMEIMGRVGYDFAVVDNEHSPMSQTTIREMMRASEVAGIDMTPIVRVKQSSAPEIHQALDMGAMGIQVPNVDTYEEALEACAAMYYTPKGHRGFGSGQRGIGYGFMPKEEYFDTANNEVLSIIQCESLESVKNLDRILGIESLDVVFIGAMDLSCSMGKETRAKRYHPEVVRVFNETVKRILAAGKIVGATAATPEEVIEMRDMGVQYLSVGLDMAFMRDTAIKSLEQMRKALT